MATFGNRIMGGATQGRKWWWIGILAVVLALYFSWWPIIRSDLPVHHAEAWPHFYHDGGLPKERLSPHVRFLDPEQNELLLRIPERVVPDGPAPYVGAVYKLDIDAQKLSAVPAQAWNGASGEIVGCGQSSGHPLHPFSWHSVDHKLYRGGTVLPTAGEFTITSASPWKSDYIAVLSADGPRTSIGLLFSSGASYGGQHYHQTFSVKRGAFVGPAVKLPFTTRGEYWAPCLVDSRVVLYLENSRDLLVAVPLELE